MKLSLAPIQGMTIAAYRKIFNEIFGGFDDYYSPFIATTSIRKGSDALFKDILKENNDPKIETIPQLISNNASDFSYFANKIVDLGYKEINWNIGCPFPTVTKKIKGSGILEYPELIKKFLDEVCKDTSYDLTIKMRLGLNDYEEGYEVIKLLNKYPLKGVMIHARTGLQKYAGHVDLDAFEVLYKACEHDMTYNGDIYTVKNYQDIQKRFPNINQFMLGRGALQDPFLPSMIKGKVYTLEEKMLKINEFHDALYSYYKLAMSGDTHLLNKLKEFWSYTAVHLDPNGKYMKKIKKSKNRFAYDDVMKELLNPNNKWT